MSGAKRVSYYYHGACQRVVGEGAQCGRFRAETSLFALRFRRPHARRGASRVPDFAPIATRRGQAAFFLRSRRARTALACAPLTVVRSPEDVGNYYYGRCMSPGPLLLTCASL